MKLEGKLRSTALPAEKLDALAALREADAVDVLKQHTEHMDFSDYPLTPAMVNILCSELQLNCKVKSLLLRNSGMDNELLAILARGCGIKVQLVLGSLWCDE